MLVRHREIFGGSAQVFFACLFLLKRHWNKEDTMNGGEDKICKNSLFSETKFHSYL